MLDFVLYLFVQSGFFLWKFAVLACSFSFIFLRLCAVEGFVMRSFLMTAMVAMVLLGSGCGMLFASGATGYASAHSTVQRSNVAAAESLVRTQDQHLLNSEEVKVRVSYRSCVANVHSRDEMWRCRALLDGAGYGSLGYGRGDDDVMDDFVREHVAYESRQLMGIQARVSGFESRLSAETAARVSQRASASRDAELLRARIEYVSAKVETLKIRESELRVALAHAVGLSSGNAEAAEAALRGLAGKLRNFENELAALRAAEGR